MRKVIFQQWLSMDGYAADANGNVDFLEVYTDKKYSDREQLDFLDTIDTILLGANTYQLFVSFWPTATNEQEIIADKLNSIPKIIFSKTLPKAPWGKWPEATVIPTDAATTVKELKAQPGKDIVLWGSISLAQDLIRHNLIDEYHFRILPLVLGSGRPMFGSVGRMNFELYDAKNHDSGLILLKYKPRQ